MMQTQLAEIVGRLGLPGPIAKNILLLAAAREAQDETPIRAAEELSLVLGSWLLRIAHVQPDAVVLLLKEMLPLLREISPEILRVWVADDNTVAVPAQELYLAEQRYALWGNREQFWDTREACYLNPLPSQPIWRTSVHLAALYFAYLRLKESKDANQPEHNQKSAR